MVLVSTITVCVSLFFTVVLRSFSRAELHFLRARFFCRQNAACCCSVGPPYSEWLKILPCDAIPGSPTAVTGPAVGTPHDDRQIRIAVLKSTCATPSADTRDSIHPGSLVRPRVADAYPAGAIHFAAAIPTKLYLYPPVLDPSRFPLRPPRPVTMAPPAAFCVVCLHRPLRAAEHLAGGVQFKTGGKVKCWSCLRCAARCPAQTARSASADIPD